MVHRALFLDLKNMQEPLYWDDSYYRQFTFPVRKISSFGYLSFWSNESEDIRSGYESPFGGLWKVQENADQESALRHLLTVCESIPKMKSDSRIFIRSAPDCLFDSQHYLETSFLYRIGFEKEYEEIDHLVLLEDRIQDKWNRNRKREFKKTEKFVETIVLKEFAEVALIVEVLDKNRRNRGLVNDLTIEKLSIMNSYFGEKMKLYFTIDSDRNEVIAAGVCQILTSEIAYVYKWGDIRDSKIQSFGMSPMSNLANGIFTDLKNIGIKKVYLGSSSLLGQKDEGLSRFKESFGAISTSKQILSITIGKIYDILR